MLNNENTNFTMFLLSCNKYKVKPVCSKVLCCALMPLRHGTVFAHLLKPVLKKYLDRNYSVQVGQKSQIDSHAYDSAKSLQNKCCATITKLYWLHTVIPLNCFEKVDS